MGYIDLPVKKIYLNYINAENHFITDSTFVKNRHFIFKGGTNGYYLAKIFCKNPNAVSKTQSFIEYNFGLENSLLKLRIKNKIFNITGNHSQREIETLFTKFGIASLQKTIDKLSNKNKDSIHRIDKLASVQAKYYQTLLQYYVKNKSHRAISYLLFESRGYINYQSLDSLFFGLPIFQQNDYYAYRYKNDYNRRQLKISQLYKKVLDFSTFNYFKDTITLFSFTKKGYVYLDFWASWCNPCRAEHPDLLNLFSQYKKYGFQIISISCDEETDEKDWRNAIQNDSIFIWENILTTPPNKPISESRLNLLNEYDVTSFPTGFLINKENLIVARINKFEELKTIMTKIYGE
jgi:thiol-disulfide isomerase/thioredoxin